MYILRWISLHTAKKGESATRLTSEAEARRFVGDMNRVERGHFHWYFVKAQAAP